MVLHDVSEAKFAQLLKEGGVIFVSINDMEVNNLRYMMNDLFGEDQFIAQFIWKSRLNKDNRNTTGVSIDHEYIVCYGKRVKGDERKIDQYSNPDNDIRGDWSSGNMVGMASKTARPNLHYDLINPETNINYGCPDQGWRYEPARMQKMMAEKKILWPASVAGRPREKVFFNELEGEPNISSIIGAGLYTKDGTEEIEAIFGTRPFTFPKPSMLIRQLVIQSGVKDGLFLDSFAGSGTTAHAILAQNKADGGNRRFILVECEDYADSVTAERVRRVIKGYKYKGTQKEELFREKMNFSALKDAQKILLKVEATENLKKDRFDKITKTIKNDELLVVGEKKIKERVDGLGGGFTYYTLGDPLDLDKLLTGENLPDYANMGAWLFHTATGEPLNQTDVRQDEWYLGQSRNYHVWLIYKPDLDFLKSRDAALTLSLAEKIAETYKDKKHLVFAPARFVANKFLRPLGVEHAPLPFALYRFEKG